MQANIPAILDELEAILALEVDAKGQVIVKLAGKLLSGKLISGLANNRRRYVYVAGMLKRQECLNENSIFSLWHRLNYISFYFVEYLITWNSWARQSTN